MNRLLAAGARVSRAREAFVVEGRRYGPGAYVIEGARSLDSTVRDVAQEMGIEFAGVSAAPPVPAGLLRSPRVGLYKSWAPTAEEGWTRWIFEGYELPYATLVDAEVHQGGLRERFDVIVLPHQPAQALLEGNSAREYPAPYAGGLGDRGSANLRAFVEEGGTIVAWDGAAEFAIKHLDLPVTNVLEGVPSTQFYAPGTFLRVLLDTDHPIAYGMPTRTSVMFERSPAFDVRRGTVVGRYPLSNLLLSGWVLGQDRLYDRAALAEVPVGDGRGCAHRLQGALPRPGPAARTASSSTPCSPARPRRKDEGREVSNASLPSVDGPGAASPLGTRSIPWPCRRHSFVVAGQVVPGAERFALAPVSSGAARSGPPPERPGSLSLPASPGSGSPGLGGWQGALTSVPRIGPSSP